SPGALYDLCRSFRDFLTDAPEELDIRDVAHSAGARRGHLEHRLALVVAGREEAIGALDAFLRGEPHVSVVTGDGRPGRRGQPVLVFSDGEGIRPRAARVLFSREPAFRAAIERCDEYLGRATRRPSSLDADECDAPARFAIQ